MHPILASGFAFFAMLQQVRADLRAPKVRRWAVSRPGNFVLRISKTRTLAAFQSDHSGSAPRWTIERPGAREARGGKTLRELVEQIVRALVDHPDQVEVSEVSGQHAHIIEVDVAKEDRGKIVGRRGATADALRTLLKAASGKQGKRYILEIIED